MSDSDSLSCYQCGETLQTLSLPLSRFDMCPGCGVELHVCRMCMHYAPSAPDACLEEDAPVFRTKTTANFCDYFRPNPNAFDGSEKKARDRAHAQLDSLFGSATEPSDGTETEPEAALKQAEDLFK